MKKKAYVTASLASVSAFMLSACSESQEVLAERCKNEIMKGQDVSNIVACNNFDIYVTREEDSIMAGRNIPEPSVTEELRGLLQTLPVVQPPERQAREETPSLVDSAPVSAPATPAPAQSSGGGGGFHVFIFNSGGSTPIASSYAPAVQPGSNYTRENVVNRRVSPNYNRNSFSVFSSSRTNSPSVESRPARPITQSTPPSSGTRGFGATGRGVSGVS